MVIKYSSDFNSGEKCLPSSLRSEGENLRFIQVYRGGQN